MFVGPDSLDLPLTLEDARAAGVTLGSGPVMVFDDATDFAPVLVRLARFFRDESCGQCVPCRVGTVRQLEVLEQSLGAGSLTADPVVDSGSEPAADSAAEPVTDAPVGSRATPPRGRRRIELLDDISAVMSDASICGLGHTAASAVQSAVRLGLVGGLVDGLVGGLANDTANDTPNDTANGQLEATSEDAQS